jgi:hypothetical protein
MRRRTTTAPAPTDAHHLQRKPEAPIRYPLAVRALDTWQGRRDGTLDLSGGPDRLEPELTPDANPWLANNRHRELERHEHETLSHQAVSAGVRIRHTAALADLEVAEYEHARTVEALDRLPHLTDADLVRRGAAESMTPESVVRDRRRREFVRTQLAPAEERVAAAARVVAGLNAELHGLIGTLDALERVTLTRQVRVSEFHARRAQTYRRAYLRAARSRARTSPTARVTSA